MADIKIGKITHYYDKIGVAIIKLTKSLTTGETVKIVGHGKEFTQEVASLQLEHQVIPTAKKNQEVGVKVDQKVKQGDEVYKV